MPEKIQATLSLQDILRIRIFGHKDLPSLQREKKICLKEEQFMLIRFFLNEPNGKA